jgi:hypothetical protein
MLACIGLFDMHILDMLAFIGQFYLSAILGIVILDMEPAWVISEYYCVFFGYIDTLPFGLLCLLGYFAPWAVLPLGLFCLLGSFVSWTALPLGLLCLLGYFASWAIYRHFASWAMSHRHCLLRQCRNTVMPLGLLLHAATWAMSHRHCLF